MSKYKSTRYVFIGPENWTGFMLEWFLFKDYEPVLGMYKLHGKAAHTYSESIQELAEICGVHCRTRWNIPSSFQNCKKQNKNKNKNLLIPFQNSLKHFESILKLAKSFFKKSESHSRTRWNIRSQFQNSLRYFDLEMNSGNPWVQCQRLIRKPHKHCYRWR